jgi:hypothetical protein
MQRQQEAIALKYEKCSYSREVTKFAKKNRWIYKHLNHLFGEVPWFDNYLISLRLRVFA